MELNDQQRDVLAAVRAVGQTTLSELARVTGLPTMTLKKLLGELEVAKREASLAKRRPDSIVPVVHG